MLTKVIKKHKPFNCKKKKKNKTKVVADILNFPVQFPTMYADLLTCTAVITPKTEENFPSILKLYFPSSCKGELFFLLPDEIANVPA